MLLITNIPTPYRIPLFNKLAVLRNGDLTVLFAAMGYERRKWQIDPASFKFQYHVLDSGGSYNAQSQGMIFYFRGLVGYLWQHRPKMIVCSGFSVATTIVFLWCLITRSRYVIWSGATFKNSSATGLRAIQRRILARFAAGCIAYGTEAKQYLEVLGAKNVSTAINTVDTAFFSESQPKQRTGLLCVGEMQARKRLDLAIRASVGHDLTIVGDGPERDTLEDLAKSLGASVTFAGYEQREAIRDRLHSAACFLFSSERDIWGLVLVEAMAAGIPCIVSPHPSAVTDLIDDGVNGFIVDFEDTTAVRDRIDWLLANQAEAARIGNAGAETIKAQATIEISAKQFVWSLLKF